MQDAISRLVGLNQSGKIHSTQNLKCSACDGKEVELVLIIFDDGQTSVSCPASRVNHRCLYEISPKPIRWYNQRWLLYVLILIVFIVTLTYNLLKDGIIKIS
jgi:hypothetical protein